MKKLLLLGVTLLTLGAVSCGGDAGSGIVELENPFSESKRVSNDEALEFINTSKSHLDEDIYIDGLVTFYRIGYGNDEDFTIRVHYNPEDSRITDGAYYLIADEDSAQGKYDSQDLHDCTGFFFSSGFLNASNFLENYPQATKSYKLDNSHYGLYHVDDNYEASITYTAIKYDNHGLISRYSIWEVARSTNVKVSVVEISVSFQIVS